MKKVIYVNNLITTFRKQKPTNFNIAYSSKLNLKNVWEVLNGKRLNFMLKLFK